ncbi:hypothetical protein OX283_014840, partial [Flavobacterium sp. SUN052]|uniref:hypothetical protein n=1 Tax=Flavobacterium sp. SUN052 TaxID=3002441 RepID=UPI002DBC0817
WSANGTNYTESGVYTNITSNASGCTDTATLVLTINNSTTSSMSVIACNSYTWYVNGTTYTQSGTYIITIGCNIRILNLTIQPFVAFYADADGDLFGSPSFFQLACSAPVGFVTNSLDCNDNQLQYADLDADGFGSTTLVACGGVTNNTDCNDNQVRYLDADGDGYGSVAMIKVACG